MPILAPAVTVISPRHGTPSHDYVCDEMRWIDLQNCTSGATPELPINWQLGALQ
jgi:hypothetical protein